MIVLGTLASFAAIAGLCWLVFSLAVFALPFLIGLHTCIWAYGASAGWLGAILFGGFAAGSTLAIGQALIILVRPLWASFAIALIFVVPAVLAGFYATLGTTRTMMPSETWQMIFAVIGAGAVGVSAFLRVAGMAADSSRPIEASECRGCEQIGHEHIPARRNERQRILRHSARIPGLNT